MKNKNKLFYRTFKGGKVMATNSGVLTDWEEINLLLLAMKADGLGNDLVTSGVLQGIEIRVARTFIKQALEKMANPQNYSIPDNRITETVLQKLVPDEKAEIGKTIRLLNPKERMEKFFAQHGISL